MQQLLLAVTYLLAFNLRLLCTSRSPKPEQTNAHKRHIWYCTVPINAISILPLGLCVTAAATTRIQ
ncbi:hypothetical protein B0O99DRAFT_609783 [Bisporella sp. PMI_857]|nr:hypothetical protein B0O99DRAFT_609783 [Bisporella sp. PMI_857]